MPVALPKVLPVPETGAIDGWLLLQVPVGVAELREDEAPIQMFVLPVMAAGVELTVIPAKALQLVGRV